MRRKGGIQPMLVIMTPDATPQQIDRVLDCVAAMGGSAERHRTREVVVAVRPASLDADVLRDLPGVADVRREGPGYWLVSRDFQPQDTVVEVRGRRIGGETPVLMAGPCAVESEDQLLRSAEAAVEAGAGILRGGAFKPRTSPYSFQGLGEAGLEMLARVRERLGVPVVSEMRDVSTLDLFLRYEVDIIQIGARNMQNYELLRRAGAARRPVLLKRGPAASVVEWLMAAEYVMLSGNPRVILCERGIVPPSAGSTRYLLDVAAIPMAKALSHLPVIADPSHAAGARDWVAPLARSAVAAGADGLLVEVHGDPGRALCDGRQALTPEMLRELVGELRERGFLPREPGRALRPVAWPEA